MAAYETARLAIVPGITRDDLQTMCDVFLRGRRIDGYVLQLSAEPESMTYKEPYTVSIEIPAERCALVGTWFYHGQLFKESVTIMAEFGSVAQ